MNLILRRLRDNGEATVGHLKDGFINVLTLEDERRTVKVKGETRIPAGTYEIKERKVLSPMTERYRQIYPWFRWHLELQDVPNFTNIYIHHGNTHHHSSGCILVGEKEAKFQLWESRPAFTRLYHYIVGALNAGQRVWISIIDEDGK